MKQTQAAFAIAGLAAVLYAGAIFVGFRVNDMSMYRSALANRAGMAWKPPSPASIPKTALGDSIRRGALIFDETPLYAGDYTGAKISCSSCHADGGIQPFASPVVGLPALFPMYNPRAGRVISLKERIQECFVRSENGRPLDFRGRHMQDLLNYIQWLSQPEPNRRPFLGRGLIQLPEMKPDPDRGRAIYAAQCAGCHGTDGRGKEPMFPPVWGPESFNDGAGIDGVRRMAEFVQHNMPQNRMGILTPQEAFDVSAYIHAQPRPAMNPAYSSY